MTLEVSFIAMYSNLLVDSTTVSCLELFQVTTTPFKTNTHLDYDFGLSMPVWKLASLYPFTTSSGSPSYISKISFVFLKYLKVFLTVVQWISLGYSLHRITILKAYVTTRQVHFIAYMIDILHVQTLQIVSCTHPQRVSR